ncbi:androglobin-like isoform X6 [Physella acuta]|uniref:androglobin-like isoform X6 n=1 Tax=Physella acuta TaxID=109671 RepID=UPI0027DDE3A4|nr:androglobin-like isoform X6 [Physella acuta]
MKRSSISVRKGSNDESVIASSLHVRRQSVQGRRHSLVDTVHFEGVPWQSLSQSPTGGPGRRESVTTTSQLNSAVQESRKPKYVIWPEFNDADINAEKWEAAKREDKKGKSPIVPYSNLFEDPDGKIEMPPSLKVDVWKRPAEFITDRVPVVVDVDHIVDGIDLVSSNEHIDNCEFLRHCMSQIVALWDMSAVKVSSETILDALVPGDDPSHTWRPWDHIYALCKAGKGAHLPLYNNYGKYVVKLYWMGVWRKIIIDDLMPFDEEDRLLLPASALSHELWPMLLTKALIKVASLDYSGGNPSQEFGDMTAIHCLTGWLPEAIPLHYGFKKVMPGDIIEYWKCLTDLFKKERGTSQECLHTTPLPLNSHVQEVWELLKVLLPEWKLPVPEEEKKLSVDTTINLEKEKSDKDSIIKEVKEAKPGKGKDRGKEPKGKDKDKDKLKEKTSLEEIVLPEKPEMVIFATYSSTPKYPVKVSVLGEMADASEILRQNGLSHVLSHSVYIGQTRSCPLEPPPPPVIIPAWKLIRPRKKKVPPHDEPIPPPEPPKEIRCLEISSPFVNYKVSHVPIPTETHRPKSSLERGGGRSRVETDNPIDEREEYASTPPPSLDSAEIIDDPMKEDEETGKSANVKRRQSLKKLQKAVNKDKPAEKTQEPRLSFKQDLTKSKENMQTGLNDVPAGGLSVPATDTKPSPVISTSVVPIKEPALKKAWMDFDTFYKCFRTLYIFHKPNTYPCSKVYTDFKATDHSVDKPPSSLHKSAKSHPKEDIMAPATPSHNKLDKKTAASSSVDLDEIQTFGSPSDTSAPLYLFVDNLNSTDIIVSYTVVPRWFDPVVHSIDEKKFSISKSTKENDKLERELTNISTSFGDSNYLDHKNPTPITPGSLVAEPYSWKSLVTGQPVLRLRTTGTKAAVLSLPPGRHVLRLLTSSQLGHHLHLCSTANFSLGDEETIMPLLTNESCRFKENALAIITSLGKCIQVFSDPEQFKAAWSVFINNHCPYIHIKQMSKVQHFQIFNESLYLLLRRVLRDIINPEIAYAWRCFLYDAITPNILSLPTASRPAEKLQSDKASPTSSVNQERAPGEDFKSTASGGARRSTTYKEKNEDMERRNTTSTAGGASVRSSAKQPSKKRGGTASAEKTAESSHTDFAESEKIDYPWTLSTLSHTDTDVSYSLDPQLLYKEPTLEEQVASVKIQKTWRGFLVRKIREARKAGTEENSKVYDTLSKCWPFIEANAEENGLFLLREMFKKCPDIMPHYPFYKDEWNRIAYADYKGTFPDQPSMNWFIVFRDIFHVKEEMLVVPKLYVPINTCMLRVINNDTYEEIPRVFQKTAPYIYKKNKKGYSFVAEARTVEQPLQSNSWRMRLIGSNSPLPAPVTSEVTCNFVTKEIKDFYIPNTNNIIFRQSVKTVDDHFVSLQVSTSKRDVYIKLSIFDFDEEVISAVGKGHVVIPAFMFQKSYSLEDETRRSSSRALYSVPEDLNEKLFQAVKTTSQVGQSKAEKTTSKHKRMESIVPIDPPPPSRSSAKSDVEPPEKPEEGKPHKYTIQATVLQNSWPLSESGWRHVQMLKEMEKNELKVTNKEREPSPPPKVEKAVAKAKSKPVVGKEKGVKEKSLSQAQISEIRLSRPPSQNFDMTKAHWILRVVSDAGVGDDIEIKKDTERADEIRAIKKAWEEAEPGRAAKALQARLMYLNTHATKMAPSADLMESVVQTQASESGTTVPENERMTPVSPASPEQQYEPESILSLEPPIPAHPKEFVEPLDLTPFIRKAQGEPKYLDEAEKQKVLEQRQQQFAEYKAEREKVEQWREMDRQNRNKAKLMQLKQCQTLQAAVDAARERINIPREAIRQKFLDAEKLRLEEIERQNAALKAEQDAKAPKGGKKSGKKSGKK